jgi:hypothetical protein
MADVFDKEKPIRHSSQCRVNTTLDDFGRRTKDAEGADEAAECRVLEDGASRQVLLFYFSRGRQVGSQRFLIARLSVLFIIRDMLDIRLSACYMIRDRDPALVKLGINIRRLRKKLTLPSGIGSRSWPRPNICGWR